MTRRVAAGGGAHPCYTGHRTGKGELVYDYYRYAYRHYLQHRLSAIDGAALFDFAGALAPQVVHASSPGAADAEAIASDWQAVGDDLRAALGIAEREQASKAQ